MLQNIREKSQGWFAWVVVSVICITFALWGIHSYLYGNAHEKIVAKVNNENITEQEVNQKFNQLKDREKHLSGNLELTTAQLSQIKKTALSQLVNAVVVNQAARKNWFIANPVLAEKSLANMPIFQVNGQFSRVRFETIMSRMTYSPEEFIAQLNADIVNNQINFGISSTAFALPNEIKTAASLMNQKRNFNYAIVKKDQFLKDVKISNEDLNDYYKKNINNYKTQAKVSVQYIYLSVNDLIAKIKPTDEQLQKFYQENIGLFTLPDSWKLKSILVSVPKNASTEQFAKAKKQADYIVGLAEKNENFDDLIHLYSQDNNNNDTTKNEWQILSQMPPDAKSVASELTKVGAISQPVLTDNGYKIFKVIDYKPKTVKSVNEVKQNIEAMYKQNIAQQQYVNLTDQLSDLTYEDPGSLQSVAEQLKLPIKETDFFTQDGGKDKITENKKVISAAFSDEVVNQHLNSDLINLDDSSAVVIRLKTYIPSIVKSFESVHDGILINLQNKKSEQLANDFAKNIIAQYKNNNYKWGDVLTINKIKLITIIDASRIFDNVNKEILDYVYKLSTDDINKCFSFVLNNGDVVILQFIKINLADSNSNEAKENYFAMATKNSYGIFDQNLYVKDLMYRAKIVYEKQ